MLVRDDWGDDGTSIDDRLPTRGKPRRSGELGESAGVTCEIFFGRSKKRRVWSDRDGVDVGVDAPLVAELAGALALVLVRVGACRCSCSSRLTRSTSWSIISSSSSGRKLASVRAIWSPMRGRDDVPEKRRTRCTGDCDVRCSSSACMSVLPCRIMLSPGP